jgi:hypothetical protein
MAPPRIGYKPKRLRGSEIARGARWVPWELKGVSHEAPYNLERGSFVIRQSNFEIPDDDGVVQ